MRVHGSVLSDVRSNIAIMFVLTLPCWLVCIRMAVDYGVWGNQKPEL